MSSRCRIELTALCCLLVGAGCSRSTSQPTVQDDSERQSVIDSALAPGLDHPRKSVDPRAAAYYDNAQAVVEGKRLFSQYNCSGCHSNGGGGMGQIDNVPTCVALARGWTVMLVVTLQKRLLVTWALTALPR